MAKKFFPRVGKVITTLSLGAVASNVVVDAQPVEAKVDIVNPKITVTQVQEYGFPDVKQEWMKVPVRWGVENKIVVGYNDGTFKPNNQVTEAEFSTMMARYVKVVDVDNIVKEEGEHWSQGIYDVLERYAIPLKGYKDNKAKDTGLSRGQLARIVAAKNGFNLDERQAVYYLYENDLSFGKIDGRLDFESYDVKSAVKRAEAVAFLQRLDSVGVTTFKGKPSPVSGSDMAGIKDVPKDPTVITDKDFEDLAKEKGIVNDIPKEYAYAKKIADKYGKTLDTSGNTGYSIRGDGSLIAYTKGDYTAFTIRLTNYTKDKEIFKDVLRGIGISEKGINEIINIIEVEHRKNNNIPQYYEFIGGMVRPTGDYESERGLSLQFGLSN